MNTEQTEKTLAEFIAEHDLRLQTEFVGKEKDADGWEHFAWRVTVINAKAMHQPSYTTSFRQGTASQHWDRKGAPLHDLPRGEKWGEQVSQRMLTRRGLSVFDVECLERYAKPTPPELDCVLDCLRSDAESIESDPLFEDWASSLDYDTDSRKAEKIFHACQEIRGQLIKLLGHAAYADLTQNVERL